MSTLHGFRRKSDQSRENAVPPPRAFAELDLEKLKKDLRLSEEGEARGQKEVPPTASEVMDDVEHRIVAAVEAEHKAQQRVFDEQINAYHQRIVTLDVENEAVNISSAAQRASTEFLVKVDDGKAKLFTLWRNVCMVENQWNDFRRQHALNYPADYPLSRLWNVAIILVILAVESILNGTFLARGLETGLIGGIVEAFVIAAANVGFGVFIGDSVMRYLFHRSVTMRTLAFVEVVISAGIAVGFNLLVGHYRDALGGPDPMHASAIAFNSFTMRPFALAAFESWMLFAMGMVFSGIAMLDGFKMDDPYPGYGKINRKHDEITRDYTDEKAVVVDDLTQTRDQAIKYMRDARQSLAARRAELAATLDNKDRLTHMFDAHEAYLARAANELLAVYRNSNLRTRQTPPPAHFNRAYSLPTAGGTGGMVSAVDRNFLDASIAQTDVALKNAVDQVNAQFEDAVKAFHRLGEFAEKGDGDVRTQAA